MKAIIKPHGKHKNIAIYDCSIFQLQKVIDNVGWDVSSNSFYATERGIPQELYRREHLEIPYTMLYKIAKASLSQEIDWSPDANQLFLQSLIDHDKVVKIRQMDMDVIMQVILQDGLDPSTFKRSLRDHQLQSLAMYIVRESCGNFGQMRTGKTPPTIIYIYRCLVKKLISRALVIVPNSIKWIWYNELGKDLPEFIYSFTDVIEGTKSEKERKWNNSSFIKIANYEAVRADFEIVMKSINSNYPLPDTNNVVTPFMLVLDECHYAKNPDAKQTQCVKHLASCAKNLIIMSGTPVANKPQDVFEPIQMLAPRLLGFSRDHFIKQHAYTDGYGQISEWRKDALESIHNKMATVSVRALRKDVNLEIGKVIEPQILEMPKKLADLYEEVLTALKYEFQSEGQKNSLFITSFLARLVRLQQVTDGYLPKLSNSGVIERYVWFDKDMNIPNPKMDFIQSWMDDYLDDNGTKLVIFSRFVPVLQRLYNTYQRKYNAKIIYGDTDKHDVSRFTEQFQSDDKCKLMICNTVCAPGKDFNPCNFVFFYDRVWSYKDNIQAEDRVTGMRQTKESTIFPLCLANTIDTNLEFKVIPRKKKDADAIQDGIGIQKDSIGLQDIMELLGG